jgi:hypothetical protein
MDRTLLSLLVLALLLIGSLSPYAVLTVSSIGLLSLAVTRGSWAILQAMTMRDSIQVPRPANIRD